MRIISARLSVPPGAFVFHQSCRTTLYRNLIDALCDAAHVGPAGYRSTFSQQGSKARNFGGLARAPRTRAYRVQKFLRPLMRRGIGSARCAPNPVRHTALIFRKPRNRGMVKPAAGSTPLAYSSPEAVQTTGTVASW